MSRGGSHYGAHGGHPTGQLRQALEIVGAAAVAGEGIGGPMPRALEQQHQGDPFLGSQLGEPVALGRVSQPDGAPQHGEVLGAHEDWTAIDPTEPGDQGIGRGFRPFRAPEPPHQGSQLDEGVAIQQAAHAFAGAALAAFPPELSLRRVAKRSGGIQAPREVVEPGLPAGLAVAAGVARTCHRGAVFGARMGVADYNGAAAEGAACVPVQAGRRLADANAGHGGLCDMRRALVSFVLLIGLGVAAYASYRLVHARIEVEVYRNRLADLRRDYEGLRGEYNQAVRKTAVTELVVQDGALSVVIRTAAGDLEILETAFDPSLEIYVDFVVLDGRLWIRRVFDANTPPGEGLVVDPALVEVNWDSEAATLGKAAYRKLGDGRWVVTVTGEGALGLARREGEDPVELSPPPPIRDFMPVNAEIDHTLRDLSAAEIARALARQLAISGD